MNNPIISVVTPLSSTGNRYIGDALRSLLYQGAPSWEWVVTPNHGGEFPPAEMGSRIRIVPIEAEGIGAIKRAACELARGRYIVELDHDDLLEPDALKRIAHAFEQGADVVYSDFAEFKSETRGPNTPYRRDCGWQHYTYQPISPGFKKLIAHRAPPVTPQNIRRVEWAPNHVRAWRRDFYERIGGHDRTLPVTDDHDLMVRFFLAGARFAHIREPLYLYRVHAEQTTSARNAEIQAWHETVYWRHVYALAEKFAQDNDLAKIDLCGGINAREGYVPMDVDRGMLEKHSGIRAIAPALIPTRALTHPNGAPVAVIADLNKRWPLEDNSVGVLRASDALEHLRDPIHVFNQAFRVLAPGGFFLTHTPSTDGRGAFCDPTHVSFWNELSFRYYTDPAFARFIPAFMGRFHVASLRTFFPDAWHEKQNLSYVSCDLICEKSPYQHMGENKWR